MEVEAEAAGRAHVEELRHAQAILGEQLKSVEERERRFREEISKREAEMKDAFRALSAETLSKSAQDFLKLAGERLGAQQQMAAAELEKRRVSMEQLVRPIQEVLQRTDEKLAAIEKERTGAYAGLNEQVKAMTEANRLLRDETGKLARALREPHVRGRYGELQLRRVAELAGMSAYCDFSEQESGVDGQGNVTRPDMIVRLPSERVVVVDAKTNIQGYLDALQAGTPQEAEACLDRFARHVAEQATALGRKKYWTQYSGSPEFVVMFIPGDQFIDAALTRQPEILESAARQNVLLAGPATLIGLLRAVAVGYKEQRLAAAAEELRELGIEFHNRAALAFEHFSRLGAALNTAVDRYNEFAGSYEKRLEPTLRKFEEAGVKGSKELPDVVQVEVRARGGPQRLLSEVGGEGGERDPV
jgi:DNA recombination protein RmuC